MQSPRPKLPLRRSAGPRPRRRLILLSPPNRARAGRRFSCPSERAASSAATAPPPACRPFTAAMVKRQFVFDLPLCLLPSLARVSPPPTASPPRAGWLDPAHNSDDVAWSRTFVITLKCYSLLDCGAHRAYWIGGVTVGKGGLCERIGCPMTKSGV